MRNTLITVTALTLGAVSLTAWIAAPLGLAIALSARRDR